MSLARKKGKNLRPIGSMLQSLGRALGIQATEGEREGQKIRMGFLEEPEFPGSPKNSITLEHLIGHSRLQRSVWPKQSTFLSFWLERMWMRPLTTLALLLSEDRDQRYSKVKCPNHPAT